MTSLKFTIMLCCLAKIRSGRFVLLEKISTQRFSNCIHTDRESRKTAKQRLITSTVIYDTILPALQKPKKEPIYYNDPIKPQREPVHICICKFGKVLMTLVNCKWDFRMFSNIFVVLPWSICYTCHVTCESSWFMLCDQKISHMTFDHLIMPVTSRLHKQKATHSHYSNPMVLPAETVELERQRYQISELWPAQILISIAKMMKKPAYLLLERGHVFDAFVFYCPLELMLVGSGWL